MIRNYVKKALPHNEATLKLACNEIASGSSIKSVSRNFPTFGQWKLFKSLKSATHVLSLDSTYYYD